MTSRDRQHEEDSLYVLRIRSEEKGRARWISKFGESHNRREGQTETDPRLRLLAQKGGVRDYLDHVRKIGRTTTSRTTSSTSSCPNKLLENPPPPRQAPTSSRVVGWNLAEQERIDERNYHGRINCAERHLKRINDEHAGTRRSAAGGYVRPPRKLKALDRFFMHQGSNAEIFLQNAQFDAESGNEESSSESGRKGDPSE